MKARIPIKLTSKQTQAMNQEIRKQCNEIQKTYERDIELMILYTVAVTLGFGAKRLKRFYDDYSRLFKELSDRYEFEPDDVMWLVDHKFKEAGINAKEWIEDAYKK